ncbi:putative bacteriophage tail fiber protein U [Escherichia coli M056]|uniref:phage tail protein n=1 Tax=Escherichia coli TaxID=562 RepID=UPI000A18359E|nr:phage tail protein [Escherichia coli]OSK09070.1 putative bacteriophage tail fiber protein U [Escherichia coli M056]
MMMILGSFIFALSTTPYQQFSRENSWRHAKAERVGASPCWQFLGADEEPVTLSGTLYPEITGGDVSLLALRAMGYTGKPWPLIEGTGAVLGMFVITGLKQTRTEFFSDGKARKIDFTLTLKKVNRDLLEGINTYTARGGQILKDIAGDIF